MGRSGPIGPWAVRAQFLDPGPFGPNCWTLGRSGPIVGPWAVRAHLLDPGPFGPIGWACPMPGWAYPMPGWACPMPRSGVSHAQGPILGPIWGPIFCLGPIWVPFGDPFFVWGQFWVPFGDPFALGPIGGPWDQVGGSVRPLEAEGRLFGGLGAEPPGICPISPAGI